MLDIESDYAVWRNIIKVRATQTNSIKLNSTGLRIQPCLMTHVQHFRAKNSPSFQYEFENIKNPENKVLERPSIQGAHEGIQ
jgi:hypothetical protein